MRTLYERRVRRSKDPITALSYQLEEVRSQAEFEAVVLADDAGLMVAWSGDRNICEELGAYAPLLQQSFLPTPLPPLLFGGNVRVQSLRLNGQDLFMATIGGIEDTAESGIEHCAQGVRRILSFN